MSTVLSQYEIMLRMPYFTLRQAFSSLTSLSNFVNKIFILLLIRERVLSPVVFLHTRRARYMELVVPPPKSRARPTKKILSCLPTRAWRERMPNATASSPPLNEFPSSRNARHRDIMQLFRDLDDILKRLMVLYLRFNMIFWP